MIFLILAMIFQSACASVDRGENPNAGDLAGTYHVVKKGDKLAPIAKKYHVSVAEIMDINGIKDKSHLKVGQHLYLPEPDLISKKLSELKPKPKEKPLNKGEKITLAKSQKIFELPVKGDIVRGYSSAKGNPYDGIAIKALMGTKVKAALDGRVIFVGNDGTKFGLLVIIEHKDPYVTVYTQLDRAMVSVGQQLRKGEAFATVGQSGGTRFPHLHFQIRVDQRPEDPKNYLKPGS